MKSARFSADDFQVGSRYRNRIGTYEVRAIEGNYVRVAYDNGREDILNAEIQARIIENVRRSTMLRDVQPSQVSNRTRRRNNSRRASTARTSRSRPGGIVRGRNFYQSVGFLASRTTMVEAIIIPSRQMQFEEKYREVTGFTVGREAVGLSVHNRDIQKWGDELRVTFEASSAKKDSLDFGSDVSIVDDPGNRGRSWRINRNRFWWELVEMGFTLGSSQNIDAIRAGVPSAYKVAFDQGIELARQQR